MKITQSISDYTILTQRKVYDDEEDVLRTEEQLEVLSSYGIDLYNTICGIHFIANHFRSGRLYLKDTIDEAIQLLSNKDGINLVRFSNGNIGFVAYYSGHKDAFEIIHVF